MTLSHTAVHVSVIIPVGTRISPIAELYAEYKAGLEALNAPYEMIFVIDGPHADYESALARLAAEGEPISVVSLSRRFGDATCLMVGFEQAAGAIILSLPAYLQIQGREISKLVAALNTADIAVGYREPRGGGWLETLRRRVFHGFLQWVTHLRFRDLGCNARAMKRKILEEIHLYGDQDRFLPILAERQGFRVAEVAVHQALDDGRQAVYRPRSYMSGFLDVFTVFFLVRFTKRPLRFFGMIGVATLSLGLVELLYLVFERIYFHVPLADRPALLLSALFVVLGVQIFALGLLGELIIFTHAGGRKDYQVDRVVHYSESTGDAPRVDATARSCDHQKRIASV